MLVYKIPYRRAGILVVREHYSRAWTSFFLGRERFNTKVEGLYNAWRIRVEQRFVGRELLLGVVFVTLSRKSNDSNEY